MVPRLCRYKWHSNGLKAHILDEVFYYLCSKCEVCHPGHTMLSTVVIWVKKRRVAAATNCHHRPPFLKHCLSLRAWFTPTTCGSARACALASPAHRPPIGCYQKTSGWIRAAFRSPRYSRGPISVTLFLFLLYLLRATGDVQLGVCYNERWATNVAVPNLQSAYCCCGLLSKHLFRTPKLCMCSYLGALL